MTGWGSLRAVCRGEVLRGTSGCLAVSRFGEGADHDPDPAAAHCPGPTPSVSADLVSVLARDAGLTVVSLTVALVVGCPHMMRTAQVSTSRTEGHTRQAGGRAGSPRLGLPVSS